MTSIRELRESQGLTQDEVCSRSGITRSILSAYEAGQRTPSSETLAKITRACSALPSEILAEHREQIIAVVRAHHGLAVEVFGSVARGEDRWDSDIDILVTFDDEAGYFDLGRIQSELEDLLGIPVDVVSKNSITVSDSHADLLREIKIWWRDIMEGDPDSRKLTAENMLEDM